MVSKTTETGELNATDEGQVRQLYEGFLEGWNKRSGDEMAALFAVDGNLVGFDGSQINGQAEIGTHLRRIFADHLTAAYVGIVREVRLLSPDAALLRAVAGMVPSGRSDINPAVNAIQTVVAVKGQGRWRIALFQTTPAAFHGRPDLSEQLTAELRQLVRATSSSKLD